MRTYTKTIKKIDQEFDLKFICSGGLKSSSDIIELYNSTKIKSFSMSSVFHYTELTPMSLKRELNENGVSVRL